MLLTFEWDENKATVRGPNFRIITRKASKKERYHYEEAGK